MNAFIPFSNADFFKYQGWEGFHRLVSEPDVMGRICISVAFILTIFLSSGLQNQTRLNMFGIASTGEDSLYNLIFCVINTFAYN